MNDFVQEVLHATKARLAHLPGFCRLVIYELLPYYDFSTGKILVQALDQFAKELQIESAPGRKREIVTSDTIRNAFRTIKKARPNDFVFKLVNQRIAIEMPFLRDLYQQKMREDAAVNVGDVSTSKTLAVIEESHHAVPHLSADLVIEDAEASFLQGSNNKNQNKTTTTTTTAISTAKLISQDFYPTETTISAALQEGLAKVLDENEIKEFINYNQARASRWVDFNPIYLKWLRRGKVHEQEKQAKIEQQKSSDTQGLRRFSDATATKFTRKDTPYDAVQKALLLNQQFINDNEQAIIEESLSFNEKRYSEIMDGLDFNVPPGLHQQIWQQG